MGRFNSYVTLELPFLTHLPPLPHHHALSRLFTRPLLRYVTLSTNFPFIFLIKNEILGFKKDRSRSKEISFLFHMFFFQLSTNNKKKIICLKSKTCHYCQLLVQKHYPHYKVRWEGTNKSYKTCYFVLHISYMQSFL